MPSNENLLTAAEAAEVLGCTERNVRGLAYAGKLAHIKLGRLLRFDPERVVIPPESWRV